MVSPASSLSPIFKQLINLGAILLFVVKLPCNFQEKRTTQASIIPRILENQARGKGDLRETTSEGILQCLGELFARDKACCLSPLSRLEGIPISLRALIICVHLPTEGCKSASAPGCKGRERPRCPAVQPLLQLQGNGEQALKDQSTLW